LVMCREKPVQEPHTGRTDLRKSEATVAITRYKKEGMIETDDVVAIEEPLEIYIDGSPHYLTMRLPGEEMYLALGYCFSEGIIDSMDDVHIVHYCGEEAGNRVDITLDPKRKAAKGLTIKEKRLTTYSSCGICGKEMVEDICMSLRHRENSFVIPVFRIGKIIGIVKQRQQIFAKTGATHAAGIFNRDCELLAVSEDLGRHNALDKAIGRLVFEGKVGEAMIVVVTSRVSYEMIQKTGRSGAEILIGISPVTSLAVELAKKINLTLIGFARNGRSNVYTVAERIVF
jgi:FdhD protein